MVSIAVCDDERLEQRKIVKTVRAFANSQTGYEITVYGFTSGVELLDYMENNRPFDIFILDILMPEYNGIWVAKCIRKRNIYNPIIFLSSSKEYGCETYDVKAFYYLYKPIEVSRMEDVLDAAIELLLKQRQEGVMIKTSYGNQMVNIESILFLESIGHNKEIHLDNGHTLFTRATMGELWDKFSKFTQFVMPHRSYIVNLKYVNHLTRKEMILSDGTKVLIARGAFPTIQEAYLQYVFQSTPCICEI